MKNKQLNIRISDLTYDKLVKLCEASELSQSALITILIHERFDHVQTSELQKLFITNL